MHRIHDIQYADSDVTKYMYMIALLHLKSLVYTHHFDLCSIWVIKVKMY